MWFQSIDPSEFNTFVTQESRINIAYWLAVKAEYLCQTQADAPALKFKIYCYRKRIYKLIDRVTEELGNQHGLTRQLSEHNLNYTKGFCHKSLSNIYERIRCAKSGEQFNEIDLAAAEMEFIKQRFEMIPEDSLLEEYERGIYLLYQSIILAEKHKDLSEDTMSGIQHRLDAACKIMQPGFIKIQHHCNNFISHLDIDPRQKIILVNQYIVDLSQMFDAGLSLAKMTNDIHKTVKNIRLEITSEAELLQWNEKITQIINTTQSRLIKVNLNKACNLLKAMSQPAEA